MAQMTVKTKLRPSWEGRRPSEKMSEKKTLHMEHYDQKTIGDLFE